MRIGCSEEERVCSACHRHRRERRRAHTSCMCMRTSYVCSSTICTSQMKRTGLRANSAPVSTASAAAASARQRPRGAPPSGVDSSTCLAHIAATPSCSASCAYVHKKGTRKLPIMSRRLKPSAAFSALAAKPF